MLKVALIVKQVLIHVFERFQNSLLFTPLAYEHMKSPLYQIRTK